MKDRKEEPGVKRFRTVAVYADKLRSIKRLDLSILKISPSSTVRELEGYKQEMNRLLEFLEEEKLTLDRLAEQTSPRGHEAVLSDEIDRLKSDAVMASVEVDLQTEGLLGEEGCLGREPLYRCYRRYNQSLEALLRKCRAYKMVVSGLGK